MATPFTHLLVTVASLATVYCVVAVYGSAWADDKGAVAHAPAELVELVRWHSGLTVTSSDVVSIQNGRARLPQSMRRTPRHFAYCMAVPVSGTWRQTGLIIRLTLSMCRKALASPHVIQPGPKTAQRRGER